MTMDDDRRRIDVIDAELIRLLKQRFSVSGEIGRYKQVNCMEIHDADREKELFDEYAKRIGTDGAGEYILPILSEIIRESRKYQQDQMYDFGLLGRHLTHSCSPMVHRVLGGYDFGLFEREPDQLSDFLQRGEYKGLCVTLPYKKEVMKYCSELSDAARVCGSVNVVIKREDGKLYGDNTDYYGLRYLLVSAKINVEGAKCLILGNGGVSGTVRQVLSDMFAGEIVTISRSGENTYQNLKKHGDAEYIINATPVGMYPENGRSLVDLSDFHHLKGVIDLVYNPLRTKLVLDAQKKGIPAAGGLQMLVSQAAPAVQLFTGKEVTADEIEDACRTAEQTLENIVLIGMPGCGKTTIGKRLSKITGKPFVDTDDIIEEEQDMLCRQILLTEGIERFREIEADAVRRACSEGGRIIALGGGTVETEALEDAVRENSKVVYIRRNLSELPTDGRPVSETDGVEKVFERRESLYRGWSDVQVDNEGIENAAIMIAALLGYYRKGDESR